MKTMGCSPLQYEFSRHIEPRLVVESGARIVVETEDALSGQLRNPGDRRDKSKVPYSNPVSGPIYVQDAHPGDTLAVHIESIASRDGQCATYTGPARQLAEWLGNDVPHGAHICPIRDDKVYWSDTVILPFQPMLGCIGTAPDWGVPNTAGAGNHGGNLDLMEVRPGNTVQLPVFVPGGLLYLGDAHAVMGHGELSATGLEMASTTVIRIDLLRRHAIVGPRIESPDEIMCVATGCPMERAIAEAYARLILWMESEYAWDRWRAYDLLTHVGRISVGFYGIGTVAAKMPKSFLGQ